MKSILSAILVVQLAFLNIAFAADGMATSGASEPFTVRRDDPQAKTGGVFFSSTKKNEVLFKANIWGAVQFPGVHYMPLGTRFLDAISFAGGPIDAANSDHILISSKLANGQLNLRDLSVREALTSPDSNPVLQADDIIVVKEDHTVRDTNLWINIGTFIMTAAVFGFVVTHRN